MIYGHTRNAYSGLETLLDRHNKVTTFLRDIEKLQSHANAIDHCMRYAQSETEFFSNDRYKFANVCSYYRESNGTVRINFNEPIELAQSLCRRLKEFASLEPPSHHDTPEVGTDSIWRAEALKITLMDEYVEKIQKRLEDQYREMHKINNTREMERKKRPRTEDPTPPNKENPL